MPEIFKYNQPFSLESGDSLLGYHLAYTTYGKLNAAKNNVVWIFHALTANSEAAEWWPGLVGTGKIFDPVKYFIVCVNMPGSCYGSISPLDKNPLTDKPYYHNFPFFTTRDMIRAYQPLKTFLGITKIYIGIGGSMGGQQLLEWAIEEPELFNYIFPIATNAQHSPWGIAFNASQRMAIEADVTWKDELPGAGTAGMKIARGIALLSYRNYHTYNLNQAEGVSDKIKKYKSESYQKYQGEKLAQRFTAFSYFILSKAMDAHNVARYRKTIGTALAFIKAKTLVIGISSDLLFPPCEQQLLADAIPGADFKMIESLYGHDGFLLEFEQIQNAIKNYIQNQKIETILFEIEN